MHLVQVTVKKKANVMADLMASSTVQVMVVV
jgi:hypothetical protein